MSEISTIVARQILDSRGNPTIEADVYTKSGLMGRAAVPSGASTGSKEALELRDGDATRYCGKSVMKAVSNVNDIIGPKLKGLKSTQQKQIDEVMLELDGTAEKKKLGANAILAVSMAAARAGALSEKMPLYRYLFEYLRIPNQLGKLAMPLPLMNILNGGQHAANNLDIQEFMIVPKMKASFSENLRAGVEVFHALKDLLKKKNLSTNVGDEGGFAPNLESHEMAIELLMEAIVKAKYNPGRDIDLALDCAASEFYEGGSYLFEGKKKNSSELNSYYGEMCAKYPIYSIEDGLDEQDHEGWRQLTGQLGSKVMLVGDDLFVTNKKILEEGIKQKEANSILVKVNQIGTLTETFETLLMAYEHNYKAIISHRSGETGDSFISDLAVASGAGHIKTGSLCRSDRTEKYNQLLRIEEEINSKK